MTTKAMTFEELVENEARWLAQELLRKGLEAQDLPLPKDSGLDQHLDAILKARPDLVDLAKQRVEAKTDGYSEALRAIGIEPELIEAVEI